jgi:AcrR family transcriptional regulator
VTQARSERSRRQILDAALLLFSTQGFRGTSTREIAQAASISTGALYHQFPDKEHIFNALLEEYWAAIAARDFPFNVALINGAFPDDLRALAAAARESIRQYRRYVALIYVDVVEFEGSHIRRFYSQMASRFQAFLDEFPDAQRKLRPDVDPLTAAILVSRWFLYFYSVEYVFGVPNHFGKDEDTVLGEMVEILEHGIRTLPASNRERMNR